MANTFSTEATSYLNTVPPVMVDAALAGGNLRRYRATVVMAAQASGDTITLFKVRRGIAFAFGIITASATLGATATIAIGIAGTTGKYRAAAIHTAVDTPTFFGIQSAVGAAATLTTDETIIITIAAAALPGAGSFNIDMFFSGT